MNIGHRWGINSALVKLILHFLSRDSCNCWALPGESDVLVRTPILAGEERIPYLPSKSLVDSASVLGEHRTPADIWCSARMREIADIDREKPATTSRSGTSPKYIDRPGERYFICRGVLVLLPARHWAPPSLGTTRFAQRVVRKGWRTPVTKRPGPTHHNGGFRFAQVRCVTARFLKRYTRPNY